MKLLILLLLLCWSVTLAAQTPPVSQPTQQEGFVVEHVRPKLSPDAQRIEDRCIRTTISHAVNRDSRPTKGTQGTHGQCAGQGFRGSGNDVMSGVQSPAAVR